MIFKNIHLAYLFLLLLPIIILMIIGNKKRKHRLNKAIEKKLWPTIVPHLSHTKRFWKRILVILSLICIIIAILRPQYGVIFEQIERKGQDIYIALDVSKSMLAQDIKPSRLEHAKREILSLVDELKGDRIGLIAFAGDAFIQCPLTTDYSAIKMFLNYIDPSIMPTPGTDIATAIKTARLAFKRTSKSKTPILILISDGESFENDPIKSAEVAAKSGMTIYTIGIGSPNGDPIPRFNNKNKLLGYLKDKKGTVVLSKLNETILKQIASIANGHYFNSNLGAFVIDKVYKEISKKEKQKLEESLLTLHKDRYQWVLVLALILLVFETLISSRKNINPKTNLNKDV